MASQKWILVTMRKHGPSLLTMLWRILGNEEDVCDAYQDTFLQLAHRPDRSKPRNVKAFVFRTASNVAISILRRRRVHDRACRTLAERNRTPQETDLGRDLDVEALRRELRDCVLRLPEPLRNTIVLRDLAELPYIQVARMLNVSVASARVYRCRAMRMLSKWMAPREETQP
jgi:RNA polymerase sigma factor (sigma-70 family)